MNKKVLLISLLIFFLALGASVTERTAATNAILWNEVDAPAGSGTFVSIVSGDINDDGNVDLVGGTRSGIGVVAGNGDGSWTPLSPVVNTGTWFGVALGDINNDGKLDLVAAADGLGVRIWTGDGAGSWTAMTPPTVFGRYWAVALGDVNRDGNLDIAASSGEDAGIKVWTGDGAGAWTLAATGLPLTGDYAGVALGDVDRDGKLDLVAASHGEGIRAWRQLHAWTERSSGLPNSDDYYGIALDDLDNDGDLDIVASGDGVGVHAWTGSGGSTWTWHDAAGGLPGTGNFWDVGLGDLNNDGNPDIAATAYGGGVHVWAGDGGGAWSEESTGLPTTGKYYGLTLGDFDDDGMPDLSAGHDAGVRAWLDDGTPERPGGWQRIVSPATSSAYQGLDVGDWNHDGKLDIVAASDRDGIQLWEGDGGNSWDEISDWTSPDLPTSGEFYGLAFGDIDHNGWLDVVAGSGEDDGLRAWLFRDGAWVERSTNLPNSDNFFDVDLADMDNDGDLDIVASSDVKGVIAWEAEDFAGGGGWWDDANVGLPGSGKFLGVAFADLDGDGLQDVVAGSDGNGLGIWQGDGAGHWTAQTPPSNTGTWWGVAIGDINDDGKADLVAAGESHGVRAWAGDGAFGWTALTAPAASGGYFRVVLGDLNNDGKMDVAAGKGGSGGLSVWTGDGGANWTPFNLNLPTAGDYLDVTFGEIDDDGFLDLVAVTDYSGGAVDAWTGAEGAPPSGWQNFVPTGWISETQSADVSIQVHDAGSGLDVNTAEYAFFGADGVWSDWKPANCSGSDGTTSTQTIEATGVDFGGDSGPWPHDLNLVRFRIRDMVGNIGYSGDFTVYIDASPPSNPTTFSGSHWPGVWNDEPVVEVDWSGAADETSGLDYGGYSYLFDTVCTLPDRSIDTTGSMATSDPLADGEWYISVRTRDTAGVWAPDAACEGPYRIDTGPPTNPTDFSSSHEVATWSNDNTIYVDWWGDEDAGSGVYGYSYNWLIHRSTPPETVNTTESSALSDELADGDSWYLNIRTRDRAGNWTADAVHRGPFYIDTEPPTSAAVTLPTVRSLSFDVNWAGDDGDGSGIASYDVEVRDGAGGSWSVWLPGTTSTSALFTGEAGHTYYFRSRATDNVGWDEESSEVPADGDTQTTILSELEVTAVEVTQALQNLANEVPLIAGKRTFVRVHVTSELIEVADVDARLYGFRDGAALWGSPLSPTRGRVTIKPDGGDRGTLDDAFLFELPSDWHRGEVVLTAVVDPDDEFPEVEGEANNWLEETVTFETGGDFCVNFVPIHLHPSTYGHGAAGFWDMVALMKAFYPVGERNVDIIAGLTMYPDFHPLHHYDLPDDLDQVLRDLNQRDFWTVDYCDETHYYGMIHPDSQTSGPGGLGRRPGDVAAGIMRISHNSSWPEPVGGRTLAHELGHNFGRRHVWCTGCEADGGPVDHSYPYEESTPHACGSSVPYTCRIGPDSDSEFYGFWHNSGGTPEVIEPVGAGDLMSYYYRRWISDWTYEALLAALRDAAGLASYTGELSLSTPWAQAGDYLFAAGIIDPETQTAELDPFYRTSEPDPKFVARSQAQELETAGSAHAYSLVLEDATGRVLYTHSFTETALTDLGTSPGTVVFSEILPYDDGASRVVLRHGETELASRAVSAHAPTVTLLSPNGGEAVGDQLTVTWTGADADGDDLRYTIQYSADDGETWQALAQDWAGTSYEIDANDLAVLPGSNSARMRVIASDGIHTAQDQSDMPFSLARKAPRAHILEPRSESEWALGGSIVFRGVALDAEDGTLGEAAITWSSDRSGTLGAGAELWVSDLAAGTHRITMTAVDGDGDTGTDTIIIYVGTLVKIYLPIIY